MKSFYLLSPEGFPLN